jgi:hypothetical protein
MPYVAIVPLRLMAGVPVKVHPLSARWDDLRLARGKGLHGQSHEWNDNPGCRQAPGYQEIASTTDGNIFVRFRQDCNYVADTVAQVSSDGSLKIVMAFPITVNSQRPAIASGPNGDLFMQQSGTLYRRSAAGAVTVLATSLTGATEGMAYHPVENALYYVSNGQLRKFDLVSNTESVRGPLANGRVWGVDPKGRIVGINQFKTGVYFLNTEGFIRTVHRRVIPVTSGMTNAAQSTFSGWPRANRSFTPRSRPMGSPSE